MNAPFPKPLTARELRWLRHVAVHGPQSSEFLLELCSDTHTCRDTGKRALQGLREGRWLRLPLQQQNIAKADFNPHVYDLTPKGVLHLKGLGDTDTVRPTGHWWHAFLTASMTATIAIEAERRGFRYLPAHEILSRNGTTLAVPIGQQKLIPDQFFAIDYAGRFRSFVLEVDRGTEPYASEGARKSLRRMISCYRDLTVKDALRRHYRLKSPLLILFAFSAPERATKCLEFLEEASEAFAATCLVGVMPSGFVRFAGMREAVMGPWRRFGHPSFHLFD